MSATQELKQSTAEYKGVFGLQFGVLSPDDIRNYSVAEITSAATYEGNEAVHGGLSDPRLGAERGSTTLCKTDEMDYKNNPGYFGHLVLEKPVFHLSFLDIIVRILRCVSFSTGKLLINKDDPKYAYIRRIQRPQKRLKSVMELCKTKSRDDETGALQPSFKIEQRSKLVAEFPVAKEEDINAIPDTGERKQTLTAERALNVLKLISDEDAEFIGLNPKFCRPDWLLITVLPIPPPHVRPSILTGGGMRSEDDLTGKLMEIVRTNKTLRHRVSEGAPQHVVNETVDLLQYHITTYFDNTFAGIPRATLRSGRLVKSISERLKGKEGRIRGNLMGKRVDFSARSVITPDSNLDLDELGVPRSIALTMTFPETVTPYNKHRLQELVYNGPHPPEGQTGAKNIIREDGSRVDLRFLRNDEKQLEYGFKVERHMQNGEIVLFNRQPSLHKMSMMGHRVRILPYSTFRLNLSVTPPYNADFDGDEMNMHLPQTHETKAEVKELMMVPKMIISPQANKPVMSIIQDTLLGCRLLTKRDTFLDKGELMNLLMWLKNWDGGIPTPAIVKPKPLWTGKQIFDLILPDINIRNRKAGWHDDIHDKNNIFSFGDTVVQIERGRLVSGTLCKKSLGSGGQGLIHTIWLEHGPNTARDFLTQTQSLVNQWLQQHGFSIGIGDTLADDESMQNIRDYIAKGVEDVDDLIRQWRQKQLEPLPGHTKEQTFEKKVSKALDNARDKAGESAKNALAENNNLKMMVTAGSKGSYINVNQVIACVGQQSIEGKRIGFGFEDRTLPHFTKNDYGPSCRGFVQNSYLRGLAPTEMYFHAMGGREGLIDTAVKTAETGYIQRRLVKALEDLAVQYDGTVRNSVGEVVQFLYGEDGMSGERIEAQHLDSLRLSDDDFQRRFYLDTRSFEDLVRSLGSTEVAERVMNRPEDLYVLAQEYSQLQADRETLRTLVPGPSNGQPEVNLPVNMTRILHNALKKFRDAGRQKGELNPVEVCRKVENLLDNLKSAVVPGKGSISKEAQENATMLFCILVRSTLASKRVISEYMLTQEAFDWMLGEIETRFKQSLATPGDAIGCVAAQSIGEPATQMTLNTFHFAGVSEKDVTQGVPRLKEVINIAKNIQTPSLEVYLRDVWECDKDRAKDVQAEVEYTTLQSVTERTEIYYDPDPRNTVVEEDRTFVQTYFDVPDEDVDPDKLSPWLIRIVLNREMMVDKQLSTEEVADRVNEEFKDMVKCICTNDNAETLVLHVRMLKNEQDQQMEKQEDDDEEEEDPGEADVRMQRLVESRLLTDVKLRGIRSIKKVYIREQTRHEIDSRTGAYRETKKYLLDTDGSNLKNVMCKPQVDETRTYTNHLVELFQVLGIEAARSALMYELRGVIQTGGSYVNYRHLAILCEVMTAKGHLLSITRHGFNRTDTGPLMRCTFEESVDILMRAAAFSEKDSMKGVSENIIMGQPTHMGTGAFRLKLDMGMLNQAIPLDEEAIMTTYGGEASGASCKTPGAGVMSPQLSPQASPFEGGASFSPLTGSGAYSPTSPAVNPPGSSGPSPTSPSSPQSPNYSPQSPSYSPQSPAYSPSSCVWSKRYLPVSGSSTISYTFCSLLQTRIFPNIASVLTNLARLLANISCLFTNVASVLTDVTRIFAHLVRSSLFTDCSSSALAESVLRVVTAQAKLQPSFTELLPHITCSRRRALLPYLVRIASWCLCAFRRAGDALDSHCFLCALFCALAAVSRTNRPQYRCLCCKKHLFEFVVY